MLFRNLAKAKMYPDLILQLKLEAIKLEAIWLPHQLPLALASGLKSSRQIIGFSQIF
jgi:hypothetical protein